MVNEYTIVLNSTEDIQRMMSEAEKSGIVHDYFNTVVYLRGYDESPIEVGRDLLNLYVVAQGPSPVHIRQGVSVLAEGGATAYVYDGSYVNAKGRTTVHAYGKAIVTLEDEAVAYIMSDDVSGQASDNARVFLPEAGRPGAEAFVELEGHAEIVRL